MAYLPSIDQQINKSISRRQSPWKAWVERRDAIAAATPAADDAAAVGRPHTKIPVSTTKPAATETALNATKIGYNNTRTLECCQSPGGGKKTATSAMRTRWDSVACSQPRPTARAKTTTSRQTCPRRRWRGSPQRRRRHRRHETAQRGIDCGLGDWWAACRSQPEPPQPLSAHALPRKSERQPGGAGWVRCVVGVVVVGSCALCVQHWYLVGWR